MAVASGKSLSIVEREWLLSHVSGATPSQSTNELRKQYFLSQIGGGSADVNSPDDLERQWLRKDITDNSGTPNGFRLADLWKQVLAARGLRVSKNVNENKQTYYRNVA